MEELIKMISDKAGISSEQATTALNTVTGFLKEKMPGGLGGQVEDYLKGKAGGGIADKVGDILGK